MKALTRQAPALMAVKVADEVWIVTALLHTENPTRADFTVKEIVDRAERENIFGRLRRGVYVHALQHCVANRPPSPARYCMLFATGQLTRRLVRLNDPCHPAREGGKRMPQRENMPAAYRHLQDWYLSKYSPVSPAPARTDPILALRGLGKQIWAGEEPDAYVNRLREGWE